MPVEIGGRILTKKQYKEQMSGDPGEFLKQVDEAILKYRRTQNTDYIVHNALGYAIIVLGVVTSGMAASSGLPPIWPIVVGAVVTAIGGAVKFGNFKNWPLWRYFANKLEREKDAYQGNHDVYKGLPQDQKDDLFFN